MFINCAKDPSRSRRLFKSYDARDKHTDTPNLQHSLLRWGLNRGKNTQSNDKDQSNLKKYKLIQM